MTTSKRNLTQPLYCSRDYKNTIGWNLRIETSMVFWTVIKHMFWLGLLDFYGSLNKNLLLKTYLQIFGKHFESQNCFLTLWLDVEFGTLWDVFTSNFSALLRPILKLKAYLSHRLKFQKVDRKIVTSWNIDFPIYFDIIRWSKR